MLGFRDQGGCRRLHSVKISYDVCVGTTLKDSLVSLPLTLPPLRAMQSIPVNGSCATDSVQAVQGRMIVFCESSGEWNTSPLEGRCVCKEDMENKGGICNGKFLCFFCIDEGSLPHFRYILEYCLKYSFSLELLARQLKYTVEPS